MPKFSFLSWNVRQYKGNPQRLEDVDELITALDPDVFGLIEFRKSAKNKARELMFDRFPEYDFTVTDSKKGLEVLVGTRRGKFEQVITTQRFDFNNAPRTLRPGALISVNYAGEWYSLLFLHTRSGNSQAKYKERWAAFKKIWSLQGALRMASPSGKANLIVLGDLNTMGQGAALSGDEEINQLIDAAARRNMTVLAKDSDATWHNWGRGPRHDRKPLRLSDLPNAKQSDLDHVLASKDLFFSAQGTDGSPIRVEGWQQLSGQKRIDFLWQLSDHSAVFGEVW